MAMSTMMALLQGVEQGFTIDEGPAPIAYFFMIMLFVAAVVVISTAGEDVNTLSVILALCFVALIGAFVWLVLGQEGFIYL